MMIVIETQEAEATKSKYWRPGTDAALKHLNEELQECGVAVSKSLRWGLDSRNPELDKDSETNLQWIQREFQDVIVAYANFLRELEKEKE